MQKLHAKAMVTAASMRPKAVNREQRGNEEELGKASR